MAKTITGDEVRDAVLEEEKVEKTAAARSADHMPDFEKIESSPGFRELMRKKKNFLIPTTILFLGLYLLFNVVISYTNWLESPFIGDIPWVWVFAFGLFAMTWILVTVYMKKAARFDRMANETLKEFDYDEKEDAR